MSRRQFLGTTSVSTIALWHAGPFVIAQQREQRDPVLDHVTREAGRIFKDIQERGLRGEHLRAFSANLRLATIQGRQQGLDADDPTRREESGPEQNGPLNRLEGTTSLEHEKHQFEQQFPDLKGLDLDLNRYGRRARAGYEKALDLMSASGGFTEALNQLVQLTNGLRAEIEQSLAANDGVLYPARARIVRVQMGSCELRKTALEMAEILMDAICFLALFEPLLVAPCTVLFIQVQIAKLLMIVACGG